MAIFSFFSPSVGLLSTFGDSLANTISIGRNAAGNLLVNGGAVSILGGTPTVGNTSRLQVFGRRGDDTITLRARRRPRRQCRDLRLSSPSGRRRAAQRPCAARICV